MKRTLIKIATLLLTFTLMGIIDASASEGNPDSVQKIRIAFQSGEAIVALYDNSLAREFVLRLPLEVEFEDFAKSEKIFYLKEKLNVNGGVNADEQKGDFCYFAPWGNIAVFYKGYGHGRSLYVLGRLLSGKEALAGMKNNFKARIETIAKDQ